MRRLGADAAPPAVPALAARPPAVLWGAGRPPAGSRQRGPPPQCAALPPPPPPRTDRSISEKGTLQLAIDTDSVRRVLLEFPRAAAPPAGAGDGEGPEGYAGAYCHYVEREMGGAVALVKVLQVRPGNRGLRGRPRSAACAERSEGLARVGWLLPKRAFGRASSGALGPGTPPSRPDCLEHLTA